MVFFKTIFFKRVKLQFSFLENLNQCPRYDDKCDVLEDQARSLVDGHKKTE